MAISKTSITMLSIAAALAPLPAAADTGKKNAMSESKPNTTEARNKALVEASFAAWTNSTGSPYDLLAEDVSWTIVGQSDASKTYPSRAAFIQEVITPFNARMREKLKPSIRQIYAVGDAVVIFFDARGVATDGKPYVNTYAWFWDMRDGRVVRAHAFFDSIVFNDLWRRVVPAQAAAATTR
jgi:ketosteroid isomerase-like protein